MVNNSGLKNRFYLVLIFVPLFFVVLGYLIFVANADDYIKYLPRNEDMQSIAQDYPAPPAPASLTLVPIICPIANVQNDFNDASQCSYCIQQVIPACPNCCLADPPKNARRCTVDDDAGYGCQDMAFYSNDCPPITPHAGPCSTDPDWTQSISGICHDWKTNPWGTPSSMTQKNQCQKQGCATPDPQGATKIVGPPEYWWSSQDDRPPDFPGCLSHATGCTSPYTAVPDIATSYYNIQPQVNPHPPAAPGFRYDPLTNFSNAITACNSYTTTRDTCNNRRECCTRDVCSAENPPDPGYDRNCDDESCKIRIGFPPHPAFPRCDNILADNYTAQDCAMLYNNAVHSLLTRGSGCFRLIDPNFSYRFVAKSREALTIIWQISTQPTYFANAPTYFFTKVQVFDADTGALVHDSVAHQKSLEAAFSIFCATHIPKGTLQQGHAYLARVYYFLPQIITAPTTRVVVNSVRLIFVKVRE